MTDPTVSYNRGELYQKLSDVGAFLAELRYIDRALRYLEEEQASWWQNSLTQDCFIMNVEFGSVVPFTRTYRIPHYFFGRFPWQDSKADEINNHLGGSLRKLVSGRRTT